MTLRIVTGSMAPTIAVGDVVTVARQTPEVGEVGAFLIGEHLLIHRVMARWQTAAGEFFLHKGDAGRKTGLCKSHQVVGTVLELDRVEPPYGDALRYWYTGRFVSVGAAMSRASGLRKLFLAMMQGDGSDSGDEVQLQAPVDETDDHDHVEVPRGLEETPSVAELMRLSDEEWAKARFDLLRGAERELEQSDAQRTETRRAAAAFRIEMNDWDQDEANRSEVYSPKADACHPEPRK